MRTTFFLCLAFLAGCATIPTPQQQYLTELQRYGAVAWPTTGLTVPLPDFWSSSAKIAKSHGLQREFELFMLLSAEAEMQRHGLKNEYDSLEARYRAGDASLFNEAERAFLAALVETKCRSFGYTDGTGDFNACVFEVQSKIVGQRIQVDQIVQQMLSQNRPPPINLPKQTKCTTNGNQTNCITH